MAQAKKVSAVRPAPAALFAAAALTALIAACSNASDLKVGPIDPSVIAPAEQLGKAFAMVAAHVRPAVVSVYSEKMVKVRQPEFQFPFGDDFFRQFFGQQVPANPQQPQQPRAARVQRQHGHGLRA